MSTINPPCINPNSDIAGIMVLRLHPSLPQFTLRPHLRERKMVRYRHTKIPSSPPHPSISSSPDALLYSVPLSKRLLVRGTGRLSRYYCAQPELDHQLTRISTHYHRASQCLPGISGSRGWSFTSDAVNLCSTAAKSANRHWTLTRMSSDPKSTLKVP